MIELLHGVLLEKEAGGALLDVGGIGYRVYMPTSAAALLPAANQPVKIHTHLHVREDELTLFGFINPEEREAFRLFIQTSGIGPKTALGILSCISIDQFAEAVISGDVSALVKIPGIGKKTAERIILEMKDRISRLPRMPGAPVQKLSGTGASASEALMALGCKPAVAQKAVNKALEILGVQASVEELIREALKHR